MTSDPYAFFYSALIPGLWMAWALYWWASARNVKATARRETFLSRCLHVVPLMLAALLLWEPRLPIAWLNDRFMPVTSWAFGAGAAITAVALLFAVWARRHIGRNWSAIVTLKEGHELITSGPYALVRHPIYTGLLFGFAGSALALGQWRGVIAVLLVHLSLWRKLRLEERWMRERFGASYDDYARRVKALVPYLF